MILDNSVFKKQNLPLLRIKKIMKRVSGVKSISHEVPIILEKALEMFIIELAFRSYIHTLYNKRKTLRVIFIFILCFFKIIREKIFWKR